MRISWTRGRSMMVVSAALMALQGATALAQFVPYNGNQNPGYNQYQAYSAQQTQLGHQAQPQYTLPQPQYVASAYQQAADPSLNQPMESIAPGQAQPGMVPHSAPMQAAPMQSYASAPAAGCNCQTGAPAAGYANYSAGAGYAPSTCGNYNTFDGGCGIGNYGANNAFGNGYLGAGVGNGRRWFGGFYGLFMERVGQSWRPLAFSADQALAAPYYPTRDDYVLNLQNVTETQHAGAEVRFGSTFGGGCGCGPRYAWEVAYWGLAEEEEVNTFTDFDILAGDRLYLNVDFRGLEYDPDGAGALPYRPLNEYFNYAPPTFDDPPGADPIRLNSITVRSRFSVQNIELNLLRLPLCSGGYYAAAAGAGGGFGRGGLGRGGLGRAGLGRGGFGRGGCGAGACGCDAGGCDTCGVGGCGGCGCGNGYQPRYSLTTLVGARYFRLDEDFALFLDAENTVTGASLPFDVRSEADNHLIGLQLGCNGIYRLGCTGRWALNCSANAGIYGNRSETTRSIFVPAGGNLRFVGGTNDPFTSITAEEDSVATIAELRAGVSYQYSRNWRFFGGYRALGISGIALGFDQIPDDFSSPEQVAEYVNTDGSIFLHGLQGGIECTY